MKTIINSLLILLIFSSSSAIAQQSELITPKVFKEKIDAEKGNFQIVDVRTPKEFKKGHLENAMNINFYNKDFNEQLSKLDKEKTTYVYCHSAGRSGRSMATFKLLNFKQVYDMDKGYIGWTKENYKVVKE
jgi:rhodanese-related sulfurtransferase